MTPSETTMIRITTLTAATGRRDGLIDAARQNAAAARQAPGCLSAEVAAAPEDDDAIVVVSRWADGAALRVFLDWHEGIAHASLRDFAEGAPSTRHYRAV